MTTAIIVIVLVMPVMTCCAKAPSASPVVRRQIAPAASPARCGRESKRVRRRVRALPVQQACELGRRLLDEGGDRRLVRARYLKVQVGQIRLAVMDEHLFLEPVVQRTQLDEPERPARQAARDRAVCSQWNIAEAALQGDTLGD